MRFAFIFTLLFASQAAFANKSKDFSETINKAGKQRMLSQKMAKEALFVRLGVNAEANKESLASTMSAFETSLKELMANVDNLVDSKTMRSKIKAQLDVVKNAWPAYKTALQKQNVSEIANLNPMVLKEMNSAVKLYEIASYTAGVRGKGKTINIAGRQRMLTQKLAKEILLVASKHNASENKKNIRDTKNLFETSLKSLMNGDEKSGITKPTNAKVAEQLDLVSGLWNNYAILTSTMLETGNADVAFLQGIENVNMLLLNEMNKSVGMMVEASTVAH